MNQLRARTIEAVKYSGLGQIFSQVFKLILSVVLARLLSPTEFGYIGMVLVFTNFAAIFAEMALGAALIQKEEIEERHLSTVFWTQLVLGVLLASVVCLCSQQIANFFHEPILKLFVVVISVDFILKSLSSVQQSLFQKRLQFKALFAADLISVLVAGVSAITLAFQGWGVWSLIFQILIQSSTYSILLWSFSDWRPCAIFDRPALRELLGFSSNRMGFQLVNYWTRNLDDLLIGKFVGMQALGVYSRAYGLMRLPVGQVHQVVSRVMFPSLTSIQDDKIRVKRIFLRVTRCIALFSFPAILGLLVVSKPFVETLLGEKWLEVIPILQIFCLVGLRQSIGATFGFLYMSQGRTDIQFRWSVVSGLVNCVAIAIGLSWGAIGVAIAYTLSGYLILWYPTWRIAGSMVELTFTETILNLMPTFFCAATMTSVVGVIGLLIPENTPAEFVLTIQVMCGGLVYFVLLKTLRIESYIDLIQILKEHLAKP